MNQTPTMQMSGSGPAVYKECFKCNFRGETAQANCPGCGKKLRSAKNIRVRGVIQIVTGLFLVAMMAGLSVFIGLLMTKAANDPSTVKKITDERTFFLATYAFFTIIALFGLNGIAMGTWQVIAGRRNKVFIWIMIFLLVLILMACFSLVIVMK